MNIKKIAISFLIFLFLMTILLPVSSLAVKYPDNGGLVPCGTEYIEVDGKKEITNPCEDHGFDYLLEMINIVINFILFKMAVPIAAIMFAYAGFLLVTSGGETSKRSKAKSIFTNVAIGLVLAVAAWLIINTILSLLGFKGGWIGFTG